MDVAFSACIAYAYALLPCMLDFYVTHGLDSVKRGESAGGCHCGAADRSAIAPRPERVQRAERGTPNVIGAIGASVWGWARLEKEERQERQEIRNRPQKDYIMNNESKLTVSTGFAVQ